MKLHRYIAFGILVLLAGAVTGIEARASRIVTLEVAPVEGLGDGDFARILLEMNENGASVIRTVIERTRVQVAPSDVSGKISLRLPCISADEALRLQAARAMGVLQAVPVAKGPAVEPSQVRGLIPSSTGVVEGWCEALPLSHPAEGE